MSLDTYLKRDQHYSLAMSSVVVVQVGQGVDRLRGGSSLCTWQDPLRYYELCRAGSVERCRDGLAISYGIPRSRSRRVRSASRGCPGRTTNRRAHLFSIRSISASVARLAIWARGLGRVFSNPLLGFLPRPLTRVPIPVAIEIPLLTNASYAVSREYPAKGRTQ
jgi:hypothetical protein